MFRWQHILGVVIGLAGASAILAFVDPARGPRPSGPILSECDGRIRELVIQYDPAAKDMVAPVYREFLAALDTDVMVHVLCSSRAAFEDIVSAVGHVKCTLSPIIANHPITTWARDRWVAFTPVSAGSPTVLWSPHGEAAADIWPARAGDERVGSDIAAALAPTVSARRSGLYFDGGDFLADNDNVFVVPRVLDRNIQNSVHNRDEFLKILSAQLRRRVILLNEAPEHHAGMFMASVGSKTMLVGDPSLGAKLAPAGNDAPDLPGGADFTPETQRLFDAVAAQCTAAGYRVVRIPVIPAHDGRTYLTWSNVIMNDEGGRRIVYLPFYRRADALNAAARAVWQNLGYEIRPVDCTSVYSHFGCLHCLVNVLKRSPT
jgi:hypothetical protein